jgi:hypothetical protein
MSAFRQIGVNPAMRVPAQVPTEGLQEKVAAKCDSSWPDGRTVTDALEDGTTTRHE